MKKIICNGVYKSGSTFLFMLIRDLYKNPPVPPHYASPMNELNFDLSVFLADNQSLQDSNVIIKSHISNVRILQALKNRGFIILVTERDIVDILLSHYHHFSKEKISIPFILYIVSVGLLKALEVSVYNSNLKSSNLVDCFISFHDLQVDGLSLIHLSNLLDIEHNVLLKSLRNVNFRNENNPVLKTGMKNRPWFFQRDANESIDYRVKFARAVSALAQIIITIPGVRFVMNLVINRIRYRWFESIQDNNL